MFARVSAVFILALPLLVAAGDDPAGQCNTGALKCCNDVQNSGDSDLSGFLGLLGIVVQGIDVPIGLGCTPLSVIGIGGNSCSAQPVCCTGNDFNGLITVGCTPINLNL